MKDPGIKTGGAGHACGAPSTGTTTEADMVATGLIAFQIKKILVPTDFSHCAEKALQYAIPFARHFGSELLLLHVIPPVIVLQTSEMMPQGIPEAEGEVQEGLEQLSGVSWRHISRIENGDTNAGIDSYIKIARALNVPLSSLFDDTPETTIGGGPRGGASPR